MMKDKDSAPVTFITSSFTSNRDWQFELPEWDTDKCIRCGVCYLACPDGAISQSRDGYYEANESLCKGCGVCARQCVTGCISLKPAAARPPWLTKVM